ncbi:MAG: tRNA (adenosine(37)-N6)-threonylcarbamoyltransferase complex transferase subunit TsaD [Campylobacterales bacterium]|nr:tRNA (adenosine(37)-N6)-threonylcarbamoyltransferase complex transferase subunit TsaD [Campylobacterales bacterium]
MILSIESSCDDSSVAVTQIATKKILFYRKISQESEHAKYGGVVPELASRLHAVTLPKILEEAKEYFDSLKAIAVTNEPGLGVTLMEGVAMAKSLASMLELKLIAVNHLKAHIYSLFIEKESFFPFLALLVSGGHTMILRVESYEKIAILTTTMDDSIGESYDKCAKMMELGYPGGPIIEALAIEGDRDRFDFPIPLINSPLIAFSLSGLKNAVRLQIEALGGTSNLTIQDKKDIAASFQKTIIAHLIHKSKKIFEHEHIKDFAIVGGVAANKSISNAFEILCKKHKKILHKVALQYCSDNAAMVGRYALDAYAKKDFCEISDIESIVSKKDKNRKLL